MNPKVRLFLYVVLTVCMLSCAAGLYATYYSKEPATPSQGSAGTVTSTNVTGGVTNLLTNAPAQAVADPDADDTVRKKSRRLGRLTAYGVTMFFTLLGFSVLIGFDVSRYFANRVDDLIFNDDLKGMKDPKYEEAEQIHARGEHLEAVRLMRDYLKRHPREQYVALRIAEIYENDLNNHLAAALEYEEILKKKLPHERWGWAAIHLANLYSGKLNKPEDATALLRRIIEEYGKTAAAKKARERLGLPEPVEVVARPVPEPEPEPKQEEPPSNMPKGFRPK
jgi:hypothetical protein